jgi:hypothetical protein
MGLSLYLRGSDDPSASQSLEAVLRDVRSAFQRQSGSRADVSVLLELYGSIISLCARAQRIRAIVAARSSPPQSGNASATEEGADSDEFMSSDLSSDEVRQFDGFNEELRIFGECLTAVNLAAIDIYFPGLREDLLNVTGRDLYFSQVYVDRLAPKYGLADRELPAVLVQVLDRYNGDAGPENICEQLIPVLGSGPYEHRGIRAQVSVSGVVRIIELLQACRDEIRNIVRENCEFRDLLDRRAEHEGGIYVGEIEYNISGSQVGAAGPGAHVHNVSFQQQASSAVADIDAPVLTEQLERLLAELVRQATERDHYAALVAVSDAAADAREGKTANAIAKLATVGRWVADIASKIGVSIASEAIKRATGLG